MESKERRFGSIEEIERALFPKLYEQNHPPTEPHPELEAALQHAQEQVGESDGD